MRQEDGEIKGDSKENLKECTPTAVKTKALNHDRNI